MYTSVELFKLPRTNFTVLTSINVLWMRYFYLQTKCAKPNKNTTAKKNVGVSKTKVG